MGIEQAQEALNQGLESRENSSPSTLPETSGTDPNTQGRQGAIFDLGKAERISWEGKEYTPQDFKKLVMFQSDYTKKTQELASERKFAENLLPDLTQVFENPDLADEFKKIYPQKYHSQLDKILDLKGRLQEQAQSNPQQSQNVDPQSVQKLIEKMVNAKVGPIIQDYTNREVQVIEQKLEALSTKFSKDYPLADESRVLAKAERINAEGQKLTDDVWDKLWKEDQERSKKVFDLYQKQQFESQKQANAKSRDIAKGGGVPGQAPKKMSFKEATEAAVRDLGGKN